MIMNKWDSKLKATCCALVTHAGSQVMMQKNCANPTIGVALQKLKFFCTPRS